MQKFSFFLSPLIWLVTINKPWHLMGCCVLLKVFRWLGKRCDLEQKWFDSWINYTDESQWDCKDHQWFQNECNTKYKTHLYPLFPGTSFPSWSSIFGPIFWKKKNEKIRKWSVFGKTQRVSTYLSKSITQSTSKIISGFKNQN